MLNPAVPGSRAEIQRPVSTTFIVLSLLVALILDGLPWQGVWLMLRPDFVAMVLLYWCMHKPQRIGIGVCWAVGLLADVANASLFGQHALAYAILGFGGVVLSRRLRMFDLRQQTIQVGGILALTYLAYASIHWQLNGYVVWPYFLGCLTSTLLWAPLSAIFQAIRQRPFDRE